MLESEMQHWTFALLSMFVWEGMTASLLNLRLTSHSDKSKLMKLLGDITEKAIPMVNPSSPHPVFLILSDRTSNQREVQIPSLQLDSKIVVPKLPERRILSRL
jgi:hypothetical protein